MPTLLHPASTTPHVSSRSKNQIVFGSPVWVGKPEDNPDEKPLPLPAELAGVVLHTGGGEGGEGGAPDYNYGAGVCLCLACMCVCAIVSGCAYEQLVGLMEVRV